MLQLIKELFNLLTPQQRRRFYALQVLVVLMAFAEIAGVAAIGPFMLLVADMNVLHGDGRMAALYQLSGIDQPGDFVFWTGVAVLAVLAIGAGVSMLTTWQLALFSNRIGSELSNRLYQYYIYQPWLFHTQHSSSWLTKNTASETARITNQVFAPVMQMNAKITLALFLTITAVLINPLIAISGITIFSFAYILLFMFVRQRISSHGKRISQYSNTRLTLLSEGFGGIKDILLLHRQPQFIHRFERTNTQMAHSQAINQTLSTAPQYMIELMAFGAMISLVLFLLSSHNDDMSAVLPTLAMYGMAGFKLLPAFQGIYKQLTLIRGGLPAYQAIRDDLIASGATASITPPGQSTNPLVIHRDIQLEKISFCYPGKQNPALKNISLQIPANSTVGFVGTTGSGKSTLIDIIIGLITPQHGRVLLDGTPLDADIMEKWQSSIGLVPQTIFLAKDSMAANIAFGLPQEQIDRDKVTKAAHLAHLDDVINELPEGIDTCIGEKGIQLSGGQRQRIGIARALYHDASVLIFDEATSALDGITEKMIMDAIHDFGGNKTIIIIAHRLSTLKSCDNIYMMTKGEVTDAGHYDELIKKNPTFRQMANHEPGKGGN